MPRLRPDRTPGDAHQVPASPPARGRSHFSVEPTEHPVDFAHAGENRATLPL